MKKIIGLILCVFILFGTLAGCGKQPSDTSSELSSEVSSQTSSAAAIVGGNVSSGGGAKPLINTVFAHYDGQYPKIEWQNLEGREGWSAKVVIKDLKGKTVFEQSGITTDTYTVKGNLNAGQEYKVYVYFKNPQGTEGLFGGIYGDGISVRYNKPQGKYYFDGGISLDVLNNYLNRAMAYLGVETYASMYDVVKESIIDTGVKYVQRAGCAWHPSISDETTGSLKGVIEKLHAIDPEIIFEACIFECITTAVEKIPIPAEVFKAFGLPVENRNFDFEKMIYPDGSYKNQWGNNSGVPDITQAETQMFFYHRARVYIDQGCEALHLGQAKLMGRDDTNNECWAKVIGLIRDYAKTNARRHYVIIDAHYPGQKFFDKNGNSLVDFNSFPTRMKVSKGQTDHAPSEKNPQECVIEPGHADSVYKLTVRTTSPGGWYTNKFPYLVEIDNYGVAAEKDQDKAKSNIWGYDEITWFVIQPQWYRHKFTEYLITEIDSYNENGHMSVVGKRWPTAVASGNGANVYYAAKKDGDAGYFNDLTFIKNLWNKLGK